MRSTTGAARSGAVLVVVALLLLTGCGRLSKTDYIRKADAICRETNAQSAKIPIPDKKDVRGTADYLRTTSTLLMTQDDRISALKPPKADQPRLDDVFTRQRAALSKLQDAANQYQLSDQNSAQITATAANTTLLDVKQDLQGYGFQDCANQ